MLNESTSVSTEALLYKDYFRGTLATAKIMDGIVVVIQMLEAGH